MKKNFKTSIGGQALIEGILMKGPEKTSVAVRKPDGKIEVSVKDDSKKNNKLIFKIPFIRGISKLVDSMSEGTKALYYSASFYDDEEDKKETSKFKDTLFNIFTFVFSFFIAIAIFVVIPTFIANFLKDKINNIFLLNFVEGLIRISIFLVYISLISNQKDLKRVFMYHGAEHKTIFAYENGLDLTVENVQKMNKYHPRCGTSFLFMVMLVSIIVLSFFGWPSPLMRIVSRIIALPIIAAISYEINRFIGRYDNVGVCRLLAKPGLWLQKIATVKEPDDSMVEVALAAVKEVIPSEEGLDAW